MLCLCVANGEATVSRRGLLDPVSLWAPDVTGCFTLSMVLLVLGIVLPIVGA